MSEQLIAVSLGTPFMVNLALRRLQQMGISLRRIEPDLEMLNDAARESADYLVFLGVFVFAAPQVLQRLSEILKTTDRRAVMVGTPQELAEAARFIPPAYTAARLEAPVVVTAVAAAVSAMVAPAAPPRHQLLVVDDDPVFLRMVCSFLAESYEVAAAGSGAQALQYLADHHPELVLLDYEMPVLNGPMVLESIRSELRLKDLPVYFLTGVDDRQSVERVLALHPDGYVLKSSGRQKLLEVVGAFFKHPPRKP